MKKLLCLFLAVLMVVSLFLVSCTKEEEEKTTQGGGGSQNQTTAEDTSGKFTAEVKKLNREEYLDGRYPGIRENEYKRKV